MLLRVNLVALMSSSLIYHSESQTRLNLCHGSVLYSASLLAKLPKCTATVE